MSNRFKKARARAHKAVSAMTTQDLTSLAISKKAQRQFLDSLEDRVDPDSILDNHDCPSGAERKTFGHGLGDE